MLMRKLRVNFWKVIFLLGFFLSFLLFFAIFFGQITSEHFWYILLQIRIPRVLVCSLVGASLALCGVVFQCLLHNSLADPYILGISAGASFGAVVSFTLKNFAYVLGIWHTFIFSLLGSFVAALIVLKIFFFKQPQRLILVGVVVQAFFSSFISLITTLTPYGSIRLQFWLLGGFLARDWNHFFIVFPFFLFCFMLVFLHYRELNLISFSERESLNSGVDVARVRFFFLSLVSILTGVCVSVSGTIGFVGLVVPHISRILIGSNHFFLIPFATFLGAIFLVLADLFARFLFYPIEIPVGVITSFVGAPFFIFLLKRDKNS